MLCFVLINKVAFSWTIRECEPRFEGASCPGVSSLTAGTGADREAGAEARAEGPAASEGLHPLRPASQQPPTAGRAGSCTGIYPPARPLTPHWACPVCMLRLATFTGSSVGGPRWFLPLCFVKRQGLQSRQCSDNNDGNREFTEWFFRVSKCLTTLRKMCNSQIVIWHICKSMVCKWANKTYKK